MVRFQLSWWWWDLLNRMTWPAFLRWWQELWTTPPELILCDYWCRCTSWRNVCRILLCWNITPRDTLNLSNSVFNKRLENTTSVSYPPQYIRTVCPKLTISGRNFKSIGNSHFCLHCHTASSRGVLVDVSGAPFVLAHTKWHDIRIWPLAYSHLVYATAA